MITLSLVGIGAGNPQHLTLQAIEALNAADVILIPHKGQGKDDLAGLRRKICAQVLQAPGPGLHEFDLPERDPATPDYLRRVEDWHDTIADVWLEELTAALPEGGRAAFLVWGDPSLYDSTLRIAERLKSRIPLEVRVVPGITAIQTLTASHAIPLNTIGGTFTVTTGRKLCEGGWPEGAETLVVMLDSGGAFRTLPPDGLHIWWSAYAGMENEIRLSGPLAEIRDIIVARRAAARAEHGWIMDTYLLRWL
ncbi:precorrin-6A synthase (deacetylating) [Actibacterium sp. D379-3]